jgi:hypothetical protein
MSIRSFSLSVTFGKNCFVIAAFLQSSHSFCHFPVASSSISLYSVLSGILLNVIVVSLYVCIYVCMYVCMYVCIYICMYVCIYACVYVCVCVCVCIYIYISVKSLLEAFTGKKE